MNTLDYIYEKTIHRIEYRSNMYLHSAESYRSSDSYSDSSVYFIISGVNCFSSDVCCQYPLFSEERVYVRHQDIVDWSNRTLHTFCTVPSD